MEIYCSPWILLPCPSWIIFYQYCLRDHQKLQTKAKCLINMCGMKKQASLHRWDCWHCIGCNTDPPIHIHKVIPPEVWKAFNVGINAWHITSVLYSNGDKTTWLSPFSWRLFLIHIKVYEMWPVCYCYWFNWRNYIDAPTAMLYHWNMIQSHDEQNHRELILTPLLFTSYDNYLQSSKSFQVGLKFVC
jgi:hypothetical protein